MHPYSGDGRTAVDNVAVVCKRHNREKRNLSLSEYRDRLALRRFFEGAKKRRLDPALDVFEQEERKRLVYRELSDDDFAKPTRLVERLFSHKVWDDPDPELNDLRYDNAERAKEMLRRWGLTPNWIIGVEG